MKKKYEIPQFEVLVLNEANAKFYAASPLKATFGPGAMQYADPNDNSSPIGASSIGSRASDDEVSTGYHF